ncbi:MAG: hypothetical protein NDJ92_08560 [Thermoanaerobaculia bacterium]|nr:hypothetical protein [Thermoanaerobaculia bacterium]
MDGSSGRRPATGWMRVPVVVFAIVAWSVAAAAAEPVHCGTSRANDERLRAQHRLVNERRQILAVPGIAVQNNVILVPNDDTIAPLGRAFNLTGKSVTFTRTSSSSFRSETGPLVFDDDLGSQLTLDPATRYATYTIGGFDFPFFGTSRRTLHISRYLAIYLETPPSVASVNFRQYTDAELLLQSIPVIAPMLTTPLGQTNFRPPLVYVKESGDQVVITWFEPIRALGVQAVLRSNGDIRFAYRSIANTKGGALYITSGTEPWRALTPIAATTDPPNDFATSNPPDIVAMLDIVSASADRIGSTNVVQLRVKVRNAIDRAKLGDDGSLGLNVQLSPDAFLSATISGAGVGGDRVSSTFFAASGPTPLMKVEGDTITITFAQEYALLTGPSDGVLRVAFANEKGGDTADLVGRIDVAPRPARTDFAAVGTVESFPGPISDAFIVPSSNVFSVWRRVQEQFDLDPEEIDGLAVYQNFLTLGVPVSSVGNAGVDHISIGSSISSTLPREPNLMDMHTIRELWNSSDDNAMLVLLHEFGHRWLFFIEHEANGNVSHALNSGGHPAAWVDTRAAFPVLHPYDCSVMGGMTYTDNGNGTFTGPPDTCSASYSWLELYLMGFAAPSEVPSFFYLSDSDPPIDSGTLLEGETFRATRNDLTIGNVQARMGLRSPAYPDTQREQRVLFVLVYDPAMPLPAADVDFVAHLADVFRDRFARATGNRASARTDFGTPLRRRPARR